MEFQVGDVVEYGGISGVIVRVDDRVKTYPVSVDFGTDSIFRDDFTMDGKAYIWHTIPLLKLVSRPKKKVTKTIEGWVNVYSGSVAPDITSRERAEFIAAPGRIACVKVIGSYECEE